MIYLIVSPKNPLKDGISSASAADRYNAAIAAVSRHFSENNRVLVDDIELSMPEPHYTIRTLDALKEREPGNTFTFVMGADSLADIRRWKDYSRILSDFGVAVFPRKGHDIASIKADLLKENPSYRITLLNGNRRSIYFLCRTLWVFTIYCIIYCSIICPYCAHRNSNILSLKHFTFRSNY